MNINKNSALLGAVALSGAMLCGTILKVVAEEAKPGYKDTPMLPGGKWHVHDSDRPHPPIVTPGTSSTPDTPGKAPSDAIVLFDGTDLSRWRTGDGKASGWVVADGAMQVPPAKTPGGGDIWTKDEFGDCQLHIEWATQNPPRGKSQERGNSGIFMFGKYELQVLDNFQNPTYADGQAGSVYGEAPPQVNASRPPGEWQSYDIIFTAPVFKDDKLESPAYVTILHNGVLVQNHTEIFGPTGHRSLQSYKPHAAKGPIKLQDHGNPTRYRNIWIRPLRTEGDALTEGETPAA